jgi:plastocyanin domain-containing protein
MKFLLATLLAFSFAHPGFAAKAEKSQVVDLKVTDKGFEPSSIDVKPGLPVELKITRKVEETCATTIKIPAKKIKQDLPLNKMVTVKLGKLKKGEIKFACGMDMMGGTILVK